MTTRKDLMAMMDGVIALARRAQATNDIRDEAAFDQAYAALERVLDTIVPNR